MDPLCLNVFDSSSHPSNSSSINQSIQSQEDPSNPTVRFMHMGREEDQLVNQQMKVINSSANGGQSFRKQGREIMIKVSFSNQIKTIIINESKTIFDLRLIINNIFNLFDQSYSLLSSLHYFRDPLTIADYQFTSNSIIQVYYGLRGGMFNPTSSSTNPTSNSQSPSTPSSSNFQNINFNSNVGGGYASSSQNNLNQNITSPSTSQFIGNIPSTPIGISPSSANFQNIGKVPKSQVPLPAYTGYPLAPSGNQTSTQIIDHSTLDEESSVSEEDISALSDQEIREKIMELKRNQKRMKLDINYFKQSNEELFDQFAAQQAEFALKNPSTSGITPDYLKTPTQRTRRNLSSPLQKHSNQSVPLKSSIPKLVQLPIISDFNVDIEVAYLVGSREDRMSRKATDKPAKEERLDRIPIFNKNSQFTDWWRKFCFEIKTRGLSIHYNQIRFYFLNHMDDEIRNIIAFLSTSNELELEDYVRIVLSQFVIKPKSVTEYMNEFLNIKKGVSETVNSYYYRFLQMAENAAITDIGIRSKIYLNGIQPISLYEQVIEKLGSESALLEEIHSAALKAETTFLIVKQRRLEQSSNQVGINNSNNNNNYSNNQKKAVQNSNSNSAQSSPSNTNSNSNSQSPKNGSQKKVKNQTKSSQNNSKDQGKPTECHYCGKVHDFRTCQKKYYNYSFEEARLLELVGRDPLPRKNKPDWKDRYTAETPWIKALLEQQGKTPQSLLVKMVSKTDPPKK